QQRSCISILLSTISITFVLHFQLPDDLLDLHSFPTRRSSDLRNCLPLNKGLIRVSIFCEGSLMRVLIAASTALCFFARSAPVKPNRKSTRLNSSHVKISYAVFCLKKKKYIDNKY